MIINWGLVLFNLHLFNLPLRERQTKTDLYCVPKENLDALKGDTEKKAFDFKYSVLSIFDKGLRGFCQVLECVGRLRGCGVRGRTRGRTCREEIKPISQRGGCGRAVPTCRQWLIVYILFSLGCIMIVHLFSISILSD